MLEDEIPQIVFTYVNEDGSVFRDAITFSSIQEMRNTSQAERHVMMQQRYDDWLYAISHPEESETPEDN